MARGPPEKEAKKDRESRLQLAIANDDVDELHNLIVEERELLDRVSKHPFPNTPLHIAAAAGNTLVAMEMAILKPSFARKLNSEGYSPMHLALQHKHYHSVRALMTLDPKLIRVRGRCGITPLHYVAEKEGDNELELLAEFLFICKSSIEDLTSRCETAVHVAVKHHNLEAFKVLFGWLKRVSMTKILNWKDEDGHTVLDIVESKKLTVSGIAEPTVFDIDESNKLTEISDLLTRIQITDLLIGYVKLIPAKQSRPPNGNFSLSRYLRRELTVLEKYVINFSHQDESARDIIIVVATLITAATYQAALSPPGGYWGDNSSNTLANSTVVAANSSGIAAEKPHQAGDIVMSGDDLYSFTVLNSMVFLVSIFTIWSTAIPLLPHTLSVYFLMLTVSVAYFVTAIMTFPKSDEVSACIILGFNWILLFVVLVVPLLLWWKYSHVQAPTPKRCPRETRRQRP